MQVMSFLKLESNNLSASSRTSKRRANFNFLSRSSLKTRPGVPTTTSGVCSCKRSSSSSIGTPPIKHWIATWGTMYQAKRVISSVTCNAISRVGVRIKAWDCRPDAIKISRVEEQNAIVLPVPDFACTMRSSPASAAGIVRICTGLGCSQPISFKLLRRGDERQRSSKLHFCVSSSATSAVLYCRIVETNAEKKEAASLI
mmetsp:Transcript_74396/g.155094  ORF Transcript_74396/g.155094 Transcript_74396/m.155094 type:complete len:200 (+) Transcript_74396:1523-2122(+)